MACPCCIYNHTTLMSSSPALGMRVFGSSAVQNGAYTQTSIAWTILTLILYGFLLSERHFLCMQGQSEGPKPPADEGSSSSGPPSLPDTLPELASLAGTEVEAIITEEVPPPPPPPDPPNEVLSRTCPHSPALLLSGLPRTGPNRRCCFGDA